MWKKKALRAVKYKGVNSGLQYPEQQIVGGKKKKVSCAGCIYETLQRIVLGY